MTKRRDIVNKLEQAGFQNKGGTNHDRFTNGKRTTFVPRHREIGDALASAILKQAGLE